MVAAPAQGPRRSRLRRLIDSGEIFRTVIAAVVLGWEVDHVVGAGPERGAVVGFLALGVLLGAAVVLAPVRVARVLYGLVVVTFLVVVARYEANALTYGAGLVVGVLGVGTLTRPDGTGPVRNRARSRTTRLVWDGPDAGEVARPDVAAVAAALRRLDGIGCTAVSLFRGAARLDVVGGNGGALLVLACEDLDARSPAWSHLAVGPQPPDETRFDAAGRRAATYVDLVVAQNQMHFRTDQVVTLEPGLRAAETFLGTGRRDPGQDWWSTDDVRPPALRRGD